MAERPLLVIRHVPWEGPHRIVRAFDGLRVEVVDALSGSGPLPDPGELCGAVVMGGPMSANDTASHPRLALEIEWLRQAIERELPALGVCLGSQLIARALGGRIGRAAVKEIGVDRIEVLDERDPLLSHLAPAARVLHWHGEVFEPPARAQVLARSQATPAQAFRSGSAWGLLFHAEADLELVESWLAEPAMRAEARDALGHDYERTLRAGAQLLEPERGDAVFAAFARRCAR